MAEKIISEPKTSILLVDDRHENLIALESVLGDLDQELVMAHSGKEALRQLLHKDFAVILLDVQMPEMDGFETATLIRARERSRHTPIVFVTANNKTDTHVTTGYSVGAVDYVFKPFVPEVLKAKVLAFVELAKKTRDLEAETLQRKQAEEDVRKLNEDLERRVTQRTSELAAANKELQKEIAEREQSEAERARLFRREQAARAEAEAAQQRLAFLAEASTILAGSLDYATTLERVAHLAVPHLADFCIVDLVGEDGQVHRVATAHTDPSKDHLLRDLDRRVLQDSPAPGPPLQALLTGEPEIITADPDAAMVHTVNADHVHLMEKLGVTSHIAVPLIARGHNIGVISFGSAESGRQYGMDDLVLAEDLARRAAAAIDNAMLFREIQESARRKDEFLAMLAHELRNPLAAISNADYVMEELACEDPRIARLQAIISRQTRHLSRLVDDLLDISRITRGAIELRKERLPLLAIVQRTLEAVTPFIEMRGHQLTVSLPLDPIWLEADPTRLEQILSNLLNNAAKYTEPGGHIWLTIEPEAGDVAIRVRDNGIGISQELMPRVFDLFAQAEASLDRSQGGLGIGLALVKNLVQMHNGTVTGSSPGPGEGSEFVARFPTIPPPEVEPPAPEPAVRENSHRHVRVLLVEDNMDAAETMTEILELWGHEVRIAHNGPAAIEEANVSQPEVVLLDIGLPGMDGYEVARRLREAQPAEMQLVAMTGYGQGEDKRKALEAGFNFHLTKPVDPAELKRLLAGMGEGGNGNG